MAIMKPGSPVLQPGVVSAGIQLAFPAYEGSGRSSSDLSGNGNTGTFNGGTAAAPGVTWTAGQSGWTWKFNGTSGYVTTPGQPYAFGKNNFTFAWTEFRTSNANGKVAIGASTLSSGSAGYQGFLFGYSSGGANLLAYMSSALTAWDIVSGTSLGAVTLNAWNTFHITRNGSTFVAYKNGVQTSTWSSSAAVYASTGSLDIGQYNQGSGTLSYFTGNMENVRIFNFPMSQSQILQDLIDPYAYCRTKNRQLWKSKAIAGRVCSPFGSPIISLNPVGPSVIHGRVVA